MSDHDTIGDDRPFLSFCPACGAAWPAIGLAASVSTACRHCRLSIHGERSKAKSKRQTVRKLAAISAIGLPPAATVLDLSSDLAAHDAANRGLTVVRASASPVDAIIAIDSLAAATDPAATLFHWRTLLKPAGILYLEVPEPATTGLRWQFNRRSLMLLMERTGFRLIRKVHEPHALAGWFRRY